MVLQLQIILQKLWKRNLYNHNLLTRHGIYCRAFFVRQTLSYNDSSFFLHKLTDQRLEDILSLSDEDSHLYYLNLIRRFYPGSDQEQKRKLMKAYRGSFTFEYLLRTEPELADAFTCIYTQTGLIREVSNDLYFIGEPYQYQIN